MSESHLFFVDNDYKITDDDRAIHHDDLLSRVKVRVGEYDASGFNPPETKAHLEYSVRS